MPDAYSIAWGLILGGLLSASWFAAVPTLRQRRHYRACVAQASRFEAIRDPRHVKICAPQARAFDQDSE